MRLSRLLAAIVAGIAVPASAIATTVIPPSFSELVAQAQAIVQAEVVSLRSERQTYKESWVIQTYVTFRVVKILKGAADETIELRFLGGTVGDDTMQVEGMPTFAVGDRSVLFVENNGTQWCPLVAVMHGRYRLQRRTADGADVVLRDNGEALGAPEQVQTPMAHGAGEHADVLARPQTVSAMTLADFELHIRGELNDAQQ